VAPSRGGSAAGFADAEAAEDATLRATCTIALTEADLAALQAPVLEDTGEAAHRLRVITLNVNSLNEHKCKVIAEHFQRSAADVYVLVDTRITTFLSGCNPGRFVVFSRATSIRALGGPFSRSVGYTNLIKVVCQVVPYALLLGFQFRICGTFIRREQDEYDRADTLTRAYRPFRGVAGS
jgi:hypothetical protein